jgi:adenosylcobinamide-GDP ribazoletransferase
VSAPLTAIAFLTRLPVAAHPSARDVARSSAWFPAVGLLIGALVLCVDRLAIRALPAQSVDVLLVVTLAAITGALHLDGLADSADGLFGGYTPQRRLEIMRDVRTGTFGTVALISVLALKWAGFAALPPEIRVEAILLAPCIARFAILPQIAAFPYAREDGVGVGYREFATAALVTGGVTALITSALLLGVGGLYVLAFAVTVALVIGAIATRMLSGVTGDIFGATVEISEALLLLFIAALADREWIEALLFG